MRASNFSSNLRMPVYAVLALLAFASVALFAPMPSVYADHEGGGPHNDEAPDAPSPDDSTESTDTNPAFALPIIIFGLDALLSDIDKEYTLGVTDQDSAALPVASIAVPAGAAYVAVGYTITGLPDGLTLNNSLIIEGTPTAVTEKPVEVIYTAIGTVINWDESEGETQRVSMKFTVTVNPAVAFSTETVESLRTSIVTWDLGQNKWLNAGDDGKVTLPTASGGTGPLTYALIDTATSKPLTESASGITFDPVTRKIGGTPPSLEIWTVTYSARDRNGSTSSATTTVLARVGGL
jgi:hypothetical protein